MADTITTITNLINSPPGQLVAGGVLAGIVWKFFERVEAVLTDSTKFEIAVWLVGVKVGQRVEPWPDTFAKVFDRVFGSRHLSLKCFLRSCIASLSSVAIVVIFMFGRDAINSLLKVRYFAFWALVGNAIPDYASLFKGRRLVETMRRTRRPPLWALLLIDVVFNIVIGLVAGIVTDSARGQTYSDLLYFDTPVPTFLESLRGGFGLLFSRPLFYVHGITWAKITVPATFFTSIWLWLYAGCGFLLKAARRFDIGFQWFNRKFDIEKKPLSAIGLVAGALVAVVYWTVVIVSRMV
jgi:hypothetical protein